MGDQQMSNVAKRETQRALATKEKGNLLFRAKDFEAAAELFSKALGYAPGAVSGLWALVFGSLWVALGRVCAG